MGPDVPWEPRWGWRDKRAEGGVRMRRWVQCRHFLYADGGVAVDSFLTVDRIKKTVAQISENFDIKRVFLFGSHSRNEATEHSDVDLCLETGTSFSLFNAGEFSQKVSESLGRSVDVVTERSLYPYARNSMLDDRILIYEQV